jgi:hypothetical protein
LATGAWRSFNFTENRASLAFIGAYSLNNRYVLNMNFRNDWSNTFGQNANRRFNPAWSTGIMWRLLEEDFMDGARDWLNVANVRLTYGTQGNVATNQTTEIVLRYLSEHPIFRDPQAMISRIANPYMTWERTQNWNAGFDAGFFNNRLSLMVDGYTRLSNVGRMFADTPEMGGFPSILTGTFIRNSGIEAHINAVPLQVNDWRISVSANIARNWNIIEREEQTDAAIGGLLYYLRGDQNRIVQGFPLGSFWGFPFAGVCPTTGIPTFHFFRPNLTDYTEEELARHPLEILQFAGTTIPTVTGGFNLRISRRNISLSSQFAFTLGGYSFLPNPFLPFVEGNMPDPTLNLNRELLGRWTPDNRDSNFPGLFIVPNLNDFPFRMALPGLAAGRQDIYAMWAMSDARVASISALRCRNITLNWQLNRQSGGAVARFLETVDLRTIDISATVNNVFLLVDSKWQGMDPAMGGDRRAPRSFTMGVNFGF